VSFLADICDVTTVIDEHAFARQGKEIRSLPIRLARQDRATLRTLLARVLGQVGATYEVVDDVIVVVPGTIELSVAQLFCDEVIRVAAVVNDAVDAEQAHVQRGIAYGEIVVQSRIKRLQDEALVALLADALRDHDPAVRAAAAGMLADLGVWGAGAVGALATALKDEQPFVRCQAAHALTRMGTSAEPAVDALAAALRDDIPAVRRDAANTLGQLGPAAAPAVPELAEALKDRQVVVRRQAAASVEAIDPKSAAVLPALVAAARDPDAEVRGCARRILAKSWGPDGLARAEVPIQERIAVFIQLLENPVVATEFDLLGALEQFGEEAVPQLVTVLQRPSDARNLAKEGVVVEVAELLRRLGPRAKAAVPELIEQLREDKQYGGASIRRTRAATILGAIGPPALPQLVEVIKDKDAESRVLAAQALGAMGPVARGAIPMLSGAVADRNTEVRKQAIDALRAIGPDFKWAVPALLEALKDPDPQVRYRAVEGLAVPGGRGVPTLIRALQDRESSVRSGVADALAIIGPPARDATEALTARLKDESYAVRAAARKALREIRQE
jgi:HEAT repeat protein